MPLNPIPVTFQGPSLAIGGNTSGVQGTITAGTAVFAGGNNITLSQSGQNITISGPAGSAIAGTQSFSGGGISVTGTAVSLALIGGSNISLASASGAGSLSLTINASSNALNNVSLLNGSSGALSVSAGAGIGIGNAASTITISASNQTSSLSYVQSLNGSSGALSLVAGSNISLSSNASTITINDTGSTLISITSVAGGATSGTANTASSSAFAFVAGSNITLSQNSTNPAITIIGASTAAAAKISLTQNLSLAEVAGTITNATGTVTGTAGFGSSLFLQRLYLPAQMNLSEIDLAMSIGFNATSNGAGTMSRSFVLYSFGNSSSLASLVSASSAFAWTTGTSTAGGSASLTQFQGGWSTPLIQPMTFASSSVPAGDYVVGQLLNFAQGSSTWTVNLYGGNANNTSTVPGVGFVNALLATATGNLTAFSGTAGTAQSQVVINTGKVAFGSSVSFITAANSTTGLTMGAALSNGAVSGLGAATTVSISTLAGSYITAAAGASVIVAGASSQYNAASYLNAAQVATSNGSSTLAFTSLPNFGYIGTGSTTSALPSAFIAGIMSTGAAPSSIAITSTAVTYSGSGAFVQPWFLLAGA